MNIGENIAEVTDDNCQNELHEWNEPHILVEMTLAILKPDVLEYHDEIEDIILRNGFSILQRKSLKLSEEHVVEFFKSYPNETYLKDLVKFLTNGISRVLLLSRRNAINRWLSIIGPSNSYRAKESNPDSLRAIYGSDDLRNAVHGSEGSTEALREIAYFFPDRVIEPLLSENGAKSFLSKSVNMTLVQGLKALSYIKPSNPLIWLADWLLEHNPFKPEVNPVILYVQ